MRENTKSLLLELLAALIAWVMIFMLFALTSAVTFTFMAMMMQAHLPPWLLGVALLFSAVFATLVILDSYIPVFPYCDSGVY